MRKSLVVLLTSIALVLGFAALADAKAAPAYKVTLKTNRASSEAGKFLLVAGKVVGPKAAGKNVVIQRKYVGGAWTTVATAVVRKNGTYAARVETPLGGNTSFRALKARSSVRKAGVSAVRTLKVYKWIYLAQESFAPISGFVRPNGPATIDGKNYKHAIVADDGNATFSYKLGDVCTSFTTAARYFANGPAVPDTMNVAFELSAKDGSATGSPAKDFALNTSATISAPTTGKRYLTVHISDIDSTSYTFVLGDPKVYCNADVLPAYDLSDAA